MTYLKNPKILLTCFLLINYPLMGIGIDLYAPSLPSIAKYFHTSDSMAKLSIAAYLGGCLFGSIILGTLSDYFGKKDSLIISMAIFTLSSFIIIFSIDINMLLIFRVIQGIGAGGLAAILKAIMVDNYKGKELSKVAVYASLCFGLGPTIAPSLGGYLEYYINWQASFIVLFIYGMIVLSLAYTILHKDNAHKSKKLSFANTLKIYKDILSNKVFLFITIALMIAYSIRVIFNVIGPFLIQGDLHYSPIAFGNIAMVLGAAALAGTVVNRLLLNLFKLEHIVFSGIALGVLGSIFLLFFGLINVLNIYVIIIPIMLIFIGESLFWPHYMAQSLSVVTEYSGTASALSSVLLAIGVFLSSSISSFIKSETQMPIAIIYIALSIVILACFFIVRNYSKASS